MNEWLSDHEVCGHVKSAVTVLYLIHHIYHISTLCTCNIQLQSEVYIHWHEHHHEHAYFRGQVFIFGGLLLAGGWNQFPSSWGDSLGLFPARRFGKVATCPNNLSLCIAVWPDDTPVLCKSAILFLRSALSSYDFPTVLCIGQSSECCQSNPFIYWSLTRGKKGLGLSKLKDIIELSAQLN